MLTNMGTRIVGLMFVSLLLTVLHFMSTLLFIKFYETPHFKLFWWIDNFTTIIDIFGNYLCVLLCFKSHNKGYYSICILVDMLCKNWWHLFIKACYSKDLKEPNNKVKSVATNISDNKLPVPALSPSIGPTANNSGNIVVPVTLHTYAPSNVDTMSGSDTCTGIDTPNDTSKDPEGQITLNLND